MDPHKLTETDSLKVRVNLDENAPEREIVHDHLKAFNLEKIAGVRTAADFQPITITLRDHNDAIVGGIYGDVFLGSLMIKILWVSEAYRGKNLGAKLMASAEEQARKFNCRVIQLDTYSFQAPEFYKKMGFEVFGTVEHHSDIRHYYFSKRLL